MKTYKQEPVKLSDELYIIHVINLSFTNKYAYAIQNVYSGSKCGTCGKKALKFWRWFYGDKCSKQAFPNVKAAQNAFYAEYPGR